MLYETITDWFLDKPQRLVLSLVVVALTLAVVMAAAVGPDKPPYQRMAEQTIIVQTGTTECHYVPAWEAVSCVTLPRTYGPEAPAAQLQEFR